MKRDISYINEKLRPAVLEYEEHFDEMCVLCGIEEDCYTTGDPDRDAAIIRECVRLDTPIEIPPTDVSSEYAEEFINAERKRLHALVP